VGARATVTRTIIEREIQLFAEITGDRNPLHFDAEFAAGTRFGRLVGAGRAHHRSVQLEAEVIEARDDKPLTRLR
jgi:acyl dehydratase